MKQQILLLNAGETPLRQRLLQALQPALPQLLVFSTDLLAGTGNADAACRQRAMHYCLPALLQAGMQVLVVHDWLTRAAKREVLTELAGYDVLLFGLCQDDDAPELHAGWTYDGEWRLTAGSDLPQLAAQMVQFLPQASGSAAWSSLQELSI
ncbi:hypothetical protein [Chitinilyticum litopenaei]|uniref:hypothetical protein n=1 Tax=Chitinilyticum litopenaei TaxID=1121276 RepID=UPI0004192A5B|nr:hypothetical protein [Chitinilyticum litopenaei]